MRKNNAGEKKKMTETQVRQSRIFNDAFAGMLFNLQINESLYHHDSKIEYKRIIDVSRLEAGKYFLRYGNNIIKFIKIK